jgi:hypothetical protein
MDTRDTTLCGTKACAVNAKRHTCSTVAFIVVSFVVVVVVWGLWLLMIMMTFSACDDVEC